MLGLLKLHGAYTYIMHMSFRLCSHSLRQLPVVHSAFDQFPCTSQG